MKYLFLLILSLLFCFPQLNAEERGVVVNEEAALLIEKSQEIIFTNPEQAVYFATKAIQLLSADERIGQKNDQLAEAMLAYSMAEKLLGNFDSSIKMLYDALEYVSSNNLTLTGKIYSSMGAIYCSLTDYNSAIEFNDKATSLFKTVNDSALIAASYNSRGIIHYNLDEFNIAEQFFLRALKINRSLKLMKEVAGNLNCHSLI